MRKYTYNSGRPKGSRITERPNITNKKVVDDWTVPVGYICNGCKQTEKHKQDCYIPRVLTGIKK